MIAPTSVVGNWVREAEKFLPSASAAAVSSPRTDGPIDEQIDDARIVVTSYTLFRLQFAAFDEYDWAAVLFDEAQFIKNHNGKTHQCARRINAGMKVAMTGTPMENSLMELWALLSVGAQGSSRRRGPSPTFSASRSSRALNPTGWHCCASASNR